MIRGGGVYQRARGISPPGDIVQETAFIPFFEHDPLIVLFF